MSLVATHSMHRGLLMSPSQKAHSLIAAVVSGVKNPCLFSFFLHPQSSGGQVEADSSTSVTALRKTAPSGFPGMV